MIKISILDYIKDLFSSNKKTAQIYATTLQKTYGESDKLEIGLYENKTPITDTDVDIEINGKTYQRTTDKNGVASLNINLNVGTYRANIKFEDDNYNPVTAYCDVIIKGNTRMEGTNVNKTIGESTPYQCAIYNQSNQRIKDNVTITVNGVPYIREADENGLYSLNINLNEGTYPIKAEFNGNVHYNPSYVNNTVTIKAKPVEPPKVEPQPSRNVKILETFESYFGKCEYIDDALAKVRGKGYAFYFSDGYNMYDTIKRIANGQGANCYDSAEVFYHLALGMNEKYGRNYEPQYLHVWCPVSGYDHIRMRFKVNGGYFYRDPASVLDGGSVESNWCGTSNNIIEVNPSFIMD